MKVAVFTLHLDPATGRFDDEELRAFCDRNQVLGVHQHLLHLDGAPAWAVLVTWRERARPARGESGRADMPAAAPETRASETPVPEADRALFDALRAWRNARATRDGRPAYVLFRNAQLADLARERPESLAAMQRIHGIGEAKARDYGPEVLAVIQVHQLGDGAGRSGPGTVTASPEDGILRATEVSSDG